MSRNSNRHKWQSMTPAQKDRVRRRFQWAINNPAFYFSLCQEKPLFHNGRKGRKNDRRY
jgi:hypothetical protein